MLYFLGAFFLSVLLTYIMIRLSSKWKIVDTPDTDRKKHKQPVPLLGGTAIFFATWALAYLAWHLGYLHTDFTARQLTFLGIGSTVVMLFGYFDDKYKMSSGSRLLLSIAAVILVLIGGMNLSGITNPFGGGTVGLDYWKIPVGFWGTILVGANILVFLWLMGMMFTTKILDGLDGLSTGISAIGALMIAALASTTKFYQPDVRMLALIFAGSCLGFLLFNFHPAKIFLGEGGGVFLGLMLGVLAVISGGKIATTLLVMAVPIIDLAWVIFSRWRSGQPVSQGDRRHLHFRLLDKGFGHRKSVLLLYLIALLFGITTLFLPSSFKLIALVVLVVLVISLEILLREKKIA